MNRKWNSESTLTPNIDKTLIDKKQRTYNIDAKLKQILENYDSDIESVCKLERAIALDLEACANREGLCRVLSKRVDPQTQSTLLREVEVPMCSSLDELFLGLKKIFVKEDRLLIERLEQSSACVIIPEQTINVALVANAFSAVLKSGNLPSFITVGSNVWNKILGNDDFAKVIDPSTKHELILIGDMGNMFSMRIRTDFYREPQLKVLDPNKFYITCANAFEFACTPIEVLIEKHRVIVRNRINLTCIHEHMAIGEVQ